MNKYRLAVMMDWRLPPPPENRASGKGTPEFLALALAVPGPPWGHFLTFS
ncbi:MAG TPA: hypothetical protein IAB44_08870 [Candidatus Limivivens intestinipullorum]|uniref:Uncharacterized protein n=1 Tax=Candidatus Limivivens intestinipullorum TaxID=2840858 RepID=A0A9D1JKF2_9FIRM|nr:hypothetical protein [Candidatus Limivivens intestinipullorum]